MRTNKFHRLSFLAYALVAGLLLSGGCRRIVTEQPASARPADPTTDQAPSPTPRASGDPTAEDTQAGATTGSPTVQEEDAKSGSTKENGADSDVISPERKIEIILGLSFYPGARRVASMSEIKPSAARVVLTTDDPVDRVVRFYEQQTGVMAQVTELSDGAIYDIVVRREDSPTGTGEPMAGVEIRPTPPSLAEKGLAGRTSIILFRH